MLRNLRVKLKRIVFLFSLALFFCLSLINPACAANADVSGWWDIEINYPPHLLYWEQTTVLSNGRTEHYSGEEDGGVFLPSSIIEVVQLPDGSISGFFNFKKSNFSYDLTITGKVSGNDIIFRQIRTTRNYTPDYSVDSKGTTIEDFTGTILGNFIHGVVVASYHGEGTVHLPDRSIYSTSDSSALGNYSLEVLNDDELDTVITSGPEETIHNRNVDFVWEGVNGDGGIAGYYYQIDSGSQVYTTLTSKTFINLSYGDHTFSVAAKDKKGNIDPTPAVWDFTIEPVKPPDPTQKSQNGPSADPRKDPGDPINVATGNMYVLTSDIALPGKGFGFDFTRTYNSRDDYAGPLGYGWTHSYNIYLTDDHINKQAKIRDGEGKEFIFADDENGGFVAQRGEHSGLTRDKAGFTWRKKNGTKFIFDLSGKLTKIIDRNLNTATLYYNKLSRLLEKITDTAARTIKFTYDSQNRITSLVIPVSKTYAYTQIYVYDLNNNLIKAIDPKGGAITYGYDAGHNITQKIDPAGNAVSFTYDGSDHCTSSTREGNYEKVSLSFDTANKITTLTDSKGAKTYYYYNADWQLSKIIDAQGNQSESGWDANLNLISRTDALGHTTNFEYDPLGNPVKITDPQGNITQFAYEPAFNNLTSSTDALGQANSFSYDKKGNLTKAVNPQGAPTYYLYDKAGQLAYAVNAYKKRISYTYDKSGNLSGVKDPAGVSVKFTYDFLGNKIKAIGPKGEATQYFYNALNQLIKVIHPNSTKALTLFSTFTYDPYGRRTSATDALGNTTAYTYDSAGKLTCVTDALGGKITYAYDSEGNLISVRDQKNNETKFAYDALNRLITKTNAANYKWQYFYDAAGNRIKEIDPKGQVSNYNYDELNRLTQILSPDTNTRFTYDPLGRRYSMVDWQGVTYYAYDATGRLISVDGPAAGDTIQYTYDSLGNRASMLDPDGKLTQYAYDAANRLTKITDSSGQPAKFYYDKYGNLSSVYYPNKALAIYLYDNYNRHYKLINRLSVKPYTQLSEYAYTYDALNRKTKMATLDATYEYGYDALSQLTFEKRSSSIATSASTYSYDPAGNRQGKNQDGVRTLYFSNALNQLTFEVAGTNYFTYSYDNNGNLIRVLQNSGAVKNFTYDSLNRLLRVYSPIAPYINEGYKYDGEGKRVAVQGLSPQGTDPKFYLYDGLSSIIERNSSGATTASYIRNPFAAGGIGGIIKGLSPQGTDPKFYHYDGLGSVSNLSNSAGANIQSYSYDSFGNIIFQAGAAANDNKFLAKETDASGLIYFGARYYEPRLGRFITPDPSGMSDGPNLYSYALNNPVNAVDLWGEDTVLVPGIARLGLGGGRKNGWSKESSVNNNLQNIGENVQEINWSGYLFDREVYANLTSELVRAEQIARGNNQPFNIVAQSWGAVVTLEVLKSTGLKVDNFITIGTPLTGISGRGEGISNWVNLFSVIDPISWSAILQFEADEQINIFSLHLLDFENPIVGFLVGDIIKEKGKK